MWSHDGQCNIGESLKLHIYAANPLCIQATAAKFTAFIIAKNNNQKRNACVCVCVCVCACVCVHAYVHVLHVCVCVRIMCCMHICVHEWVLWRSIILFIKKIYNKYQHYNHRTTNLQTAHNYTPLRISSKHIPMASSNFPWATWLCVSPIRPSRLFGNSHCLRRGYSNKHNTHEACTHL